MLKFRNINVLFIALLLLCVAADICFGMPWYAYAVLVLAYSLILFYGCYYVGSNYFIPIVCSLKTDEKVIAISFDDGPDAINTPTILQLLKTNNIKATFFCIGNRIPPNASLLKQIDDDGHLIGNHSFSHHYWFDMFAADKMLVDLKQMDTETQAIIGQTPKLFRPPYGVTNPNLKKAIINGQYTPVGWSVRSMDTVINDADKLYKKVTRKLKPGAVFLFHDTSNATVAMLPAFIQYVKANGYQVVRLDKMLNLPAYA
jgi:peptidoglycan/xylan/chitin deacetylase (PgdA/CDA1 family)